MARRTYRPAPRSAQLRPIRAPVSAPVSAPISGPRHPSGDAKSATQRRAVSDPAARSQRKSAQVSAPEKLVFPMGYAQSALTWAMTWRATPPRGGHGGGQDDFDTLTGRRAVFFLRRATSGTPSKILAQKFLAMQLTGVKKLTTLTSERSQNCLDDAYLPVW